MHLFVVLTRVITKKDQVKKKSIQFICKVWRVIIFDLTMDVRVLNIGTNDTFKGKQHKTQIYSKTKPVTNLVRFKGIENVVFVYGKPAFVPYFLVLAHLHVAWNKNEAVIGPKSCFLKL